MLNQSQQLAVESTEGPVMILAGAGSGKTRTLVKKIIYLLEEKRVSPFKILAVTFSNKAAREMRERVAAETQFDIGTLQITTFHSFCASILRKEAQYIGLSKNFTIYDDAESRAVVKSILARRGIGPKELSPYEVLYYISDIKNNGFFRDQMSDEELEIDTKDEFFQYFQEYDQELLKSNALDFGGLITGVLQLFHQFPEVLERYYKRFNYVLVDEYQDTNRAQFKLVHLLSKENRNLCVVGDEDQSIYSWRGADIRNILDFEKFYPEAKLIKLEQNYRSSKVIIDAASHVIARNEMRKGKTMWTDNQGGELIEIVECDSEKSEAEYLIASIQEIINGGESFRDIAVFYRNNSQSRVIEDELRKIKIPYRVVGGVKFYDRMEIKDILAYLRVIVNKRDSLAFSRIINVPARGIGATTLRKLEKEAVKFNVSLYELTEMIVANLDEYSHLKLSRKVKSSLDHLVGLIQEIQSSQDESPNQLVEKLLNESGYAEFLKQQKSFESMARLENIDELLNAIKQFEQSHQTPSLAGFLESVTLDQNSLSDEDKEKGEVSLMTVHGAKGLEFPYVFLAGVEENTFPSFQSLDSGQDGVEEERRLFYVAMTRAMKRLTILFSQSRMLFGSLKFNGPSRFLDEIPEKFVNWKRSFKLKSQNVDGIDYSDEYSQIEDYEDESSFPMGSQVIHSLYGEGQVLECTGRGQEEKVLVMFKDGAKKRFMVKFAPLALL